MDNCMAKLTELIGEGNDLALYIWSGELVELGKMPPSSFKRLDSGTAVWNGVIGKKVTSAKGEFVQKKVFTAWEDIAEQFEDCMPGDYIYVLAEVRNEKDSNGVYREKGVILAADVIK